MLGLAAVEPPRVDRWAFGLLDAATVDEDETSHWQLGTEYFSDACTSDGFVWSLGCGPVFSVTLTKTSTSNQFQVAFNPTSGPYEASVNGGAYTDFANGGVFTTATNPSTVVLREKTGLRRTVTLTGVNPGATTGTVYTGTSTARSGNDPKTGDEPTLVYGDPFAVGIASTCLSQALAEDWEDEVRRKFAWHEAKLVERVVWDRILATAGSAELAGGTAVPLRTAVGLLEETLAANYGGNGVFHAPRRVGAHTKSLGLAAKANASAQVMLTPLENVWAFGGGYTANTGPDGTPAGDGEAWLYATGVVTVRRSELIIPAGVETGAFDPRTNEVLIVAERVYVVDGDCPAFAVLATLED